MRLWCNTLISQIPFEKGFFLVRVASESRTRRLCANCLLAVVFFIPDVVVVVVPIVVVACHFQKILVYLLIGSEEGAGMNVNNRMSMNFSSS